MMREMGQPKTVSISYDRDKKMISFETPGQWEIRKVKTGMHYICAALNNLMEKGRYVHKTRTNERAFIFEPIIK